MSQETVAAQDMIARFAEGQGRDPESVVADATYGNGEFLQWLMEREITPYMRTRDSALRKNNPLYGPERFSYLLIIWLLKQTASSRGADSVFAQHLVLC
jgi:hypothetical protein